MKHNPFKVLITLLKCKRCGSPDPDPKTKLCRKCELNKLTKESYRGN